MNTMLISGLSYSGYLIYRQYFTKTNTLEYEKIYVESDYNDEINMCNVENENNKYKLNNIIK